MVEYMMKSGGGMKKLVSAMAIATSLLFVTGCTPSGWGSQTNDQSKQAEKEWKEEAKPPTYAPAVVHTTECLNTLNIIGLGNPGVEVDYATQTVYNAIQKKVTSNAPIANLQASLTIPSYTGSDRVMKKYVNMTDGSFKDAKDAATKAVVAAVTEAQNKCKGSKTILLGYGFGASVMHTVEKTLSPIMEKSISRTVLISDPNRSPLDNSDTLSTTSKTVSAGDGTAGGSLPFIGYEGTDSLTGAMNKKMLSVCYPTDSVCNRDTSNQAAYAYTASKSTAINDYQYVYVNPTVLDSIAAWVSEKYAADVKLAQESPDNTADVTDYLKYVNKDNIGAQVVQDTKEPAAITSCEADYAVFATRGSGENIAGNDNTGDGETIDNASGYQGGKPAQATGVVLNGITRFPATLAWEIKSKLPAGKKIRFIPVQYDAVPVPGVDKNSTNVASYMTSVEHGVTQMTSDIRNFENQCPQTPIVVIGYSQGSQVAHTTISKLTESESKQIKTVLLIADPLMDTTKTNNGIEFNPNDQDSGSFKKYSKDYKGISSLVGVDIPAYVSTKVVQICDINDPICDFTAYGAVTSMDVHSTAYSKQSHYTIPAWFAVEKLTGDSILKDELHQQVKDQLSSDKTTTSSAD